jgi:thioredoxin
MGMKKIVTIIVLLISVLAGAQTNNSSTDVMSYSEKDGLIIIELTVNGSTDKFLLDLAGKTSILEEYAKNFQIKDFIEINDSKDKFLYKNIKANKKAVINTLSFGNNVFANGLEVLIIPDTDNRLRDLGVAGIVSGTIFRNCVLTIDAKNKKITTSMPFKPSYISLRERDNIQILPGSAVEITTEIDGKAIKVLFDTWEKGLIILPQKSTGYKSLKLINVSIPNPEISVNRNISSPSIGLALLRYGIISIDFMRSKIYFQSHESTKVVEEQKKELLPVVQGKVNPITRNEFIEYIFDYKTDKEFVLKGDKPVVIDFWATWCSPCMRLMPEMEKMAEKYKDKVIFYKINADKEKEICSRFNILALPTIFFIPVGGAPIIDVGDQPAKFVEIIETKLL